MTPKETLAGNMFGAEAWAREIAPAFDRVVELLEARLASAGQKGQALRAAVLPAVPLLSVDGSRVSPCFRASVVIGGDVALDDSKLRRIAAMADIMSEAIERGGLRRCDDPGFAVEVVAALLFCCGAEDRLYRDGRGILRALRVAKLICDETRDLEGFGLPVEGSEFSSTDSRFAGLRPLLDGVAALFAFAVVAGWEGSASPPPRGPRGASALRAARWWWPWSSGAKRKVDPLRTRLAAEVDSLREVPGDCMARGIGHLDAVLKCAQPPFE